MREPMKLLRLLEVVCGVLASLAGGTTLAYLLFVPVYRGMGCSTLPGLPPDCTPTYATLLNGRDPSTQAQVALVTVLLVGLGIAVIWHVRTGRARALAALFTLTGVLFLWTTCSLLMLYGVLLPSVALAAVACVAAVLHSSDAAT
jgi:hypothetical protein